MQSPTPHVQALLIAPLGASHMAQTGTAQHLHGIPVRESTHHPRAAADLPVKTLNHVVGADVRPVPRREFKVEVSVSSIPASIFLAALVSQGGRSVPLSPGQ